MPPNPEDFLIECDKISKESAADPIWAIRGLAIQSYASLEQSLCRLFALLSGVPLEYAAVVFFRIVATGVRTSILERLLKKRQGAKYNVFWKSFEDLLRRIDVQRNHIVHWNAIITIEKDGSSEIALVHPNLWNPTSDIEEQYTSDRIFEFTKKCEFLSLLCRCLGGHISITQTPLPTEEMVKELWEKMLQTWHDVFLQPIVYPPPNNHPICQSLKEYESLLQSLRWKR